MTDWLALPFCSIAPQDDVAAARSKWEARETCDFRREVRYFDFEANGKPFTQVAVQFIPEKPLLVEGKPITIFTSEPGHDSAREFTEDDLGREGAGPWLARRGVTVISTARLGRWNLLSDDPLGSWETIPLDQRMPVFHRGQKEHWAESEFEVRDANGVSSPTGSAYCRVPRPGTALEGHMLALTPEVQMQGFLLALEGCGVMAARQDTLLFYWGFSTGGAFLWPLAKKYAPDGILGFGMSNFAVSHYASRGFNGDHRWLYDRSSTRLRERNYTDFAYFSPDHTEEQRQLEWKLALRSARFKSFEDTFMFFNVAAQAESIARLWQCDFLPEAVRARGFDRLLHSNLDLCFPDDSLRSVKVLELSGTRDEIQPPEVVSVAASITAPHCAHYQTLFLEGLHHSIAADQVPVFCSIWLETIAQGQFAAPNSSTNPVTKAKELQHG